MVCTVVLATQADALANVQKPCVVNRCVCDAVGSVGLGHMLRHGDTQGFFDTGLGPPKV